MELTEQATQETQDITVHERWLKVSVDEGLHRAVRVAAAQHDLSISSYIAMVLRRELREQMATQTAA
jgi:predicted HicB family RNase H-like nuclease